MKYRLFILTIVLSFLLGCSATPEVDGYSAKGDGFQSDRYLVRSGSVSLEVKDLTSISRSINEYVGEVNGYIDSNTRWSEKRISISARIPDGNFDSFIENLSGLGKVTSKTITVKDVTEEVVDVEAKLSNLLSLRDRFRQLLDRADKVSEVLEIERELSRIQTEIDAIEGRKSKLMGQINFSNVDIYLKQKTIYGPLGYIGIGVYWVFEKLFVIK